MYNRPEEKLNAINGELRRGPPTPRGAVPRRRRRVGRNRHRRGGGRSASAPTCTTAPARPAPGPGSFWEIPTVNSFESGMELRKPTIAAVSGHRLGYGLTLVSACDFVIAADDAEFGMPEVRIGGARSWAPCACPGAVGMQYALELLLTGDRIDAAVRRKSGSRAGSSRATSCSPRPGPSPTACARARRSPCARSRRWRTAASRCRGSMRSGWARPCAASRSPPRTPPKA